MSRTGVTRIDIPVSALSVALSVFDGGPVVLPSLTRAGIHEVALGQCSRAEAPIAGGSWRITIRRPWPATNALFIEGREETISAVVADFGRGRATLPHALLLALDTAGVDGVMATVVSTDRMDHPYRWDGSIAELRATIDPRRCAH